MLIYTKFLSVPQHSISQTVKFQNISPSDQITLKNPTFTIKNFHIHQRKPDASVWTPVGWLWNCHDGFVSDGPCKVPRSDDVGKWGTCSLSMNSYFLLFMLYCHFIFACVSPQCKTKTSSVPNFTDSTCLVRILKQWQKRYKNSKVQIWEPFLIQSFKS